MHFKHFLKMNEAGDEGGAAAPPAGEAPPVEGVRIGENGPVAKLPDGVSDAVKDAVNGPLKNFFDNEGNVNVNNVLDSYVNVQKVMGQDKILKPRQDWGEDQWTEFYRNAGVPEQIDDYKIANNVPEGMTANEEMFGALVQTAHENGILPHQFQKVADKFNELLKVGSDAQKQNDDTLLSAEVEKLKQEWGQGYENQVKVANAALEKFATEEELAELKKYGLDADPLLQRIFNKVGNGLLSEDEPIFGQQHTNTFGKTPEQAQLAITEHLKKPEARTKHQGHALWQRQYMELLEAAHGKNPANQNVNTTGNVATMR